MKEHGMIFNGEMVRAILDGRKTQTRRPIKWKQTRFTEIGEREDGSKWPWSEDAEHACDFWHPCPFGAVGDRIWVRETWNKYGGLLTYRADHDWIDDMRKETVCTAKWVPSIHMPRWASRITLEITCVRVERLNAISEEDAIAEGMQGVICPCCKGDSEYSTSQYDAETLAVVDEIPCRACESNRSKFFTLWDSIYGYGQHCIGEWVWVIEFKRVEGGAA
ncbi:TPA: hypothetical protein MFH43_001240 [Klebsiella pneumoniae]|nr:hypothetical protein [Klebsiella pneumoniae]